MRFTSQLLKGDTPPRYTALPPVPLLRGGRGGERACAIWTALCREHEAGLTLQNTHVGASGVASGRDSSRGASAGGHRSA